MNDLNINILRSPVRSRIRRILGALYILLAIIWLSTKIELRDPVSVFDIVYSVFFWLSGIIFLIDGYGINMIRWFGEAYIKIDASSIRIKKGVSSKEWLLLWSDIEKVEFSVIKIIFTLTDNSIRELDYDHLDYEHIQEIKRAIVLVGEEKRIEVMKSKQG